VLVWWAVSSFSWHWLYSRRRACGTRGVVVAYNMACHHHAWMHEDLSVCLRLKLKTSSESQTPCMVCTLSSMWYKDYSPCAGCNRDGCCVAYMGRRGQERYCRRAAACTHMRLVPFSGTWCSVTWKDIPEETQDTNHVLQLCVCMPA
jgi:hypothetical protein